MNRHHKKNFDRSKLTKKESCQPIKDIGYSGYLESTHVIRTAEESFHCFTWKIRNISFSALEKRILKSPIFTVEPHYECKWYLILKKFDKCNYYNHNFCVLYLVFDDTSDCEMAKAKFQLSVSFDKPKPVGTLKDSKFYKFEKKKERVCCSPPFVYSTPGGIELFYPTKKYSMIRYNITITCEIMTESAGPDWSLSKNFESVLKNQFLSDITIMVGEKKYPAHKIILAARSPVFAAMFAHKMKENDENVVRIQDMDENVVEAMLRYMYTEKFEDFQCSAADLLLAADKYDLKGLRLICERLLIKNLSSSNAETMLSLAELCNADKLKSRAMDVISDRCLNLFKNAAVQLSENKC